MGSDGRERECEGRIAPLSRPCALLLERERAPPSPSLKASSQQQFLLASLNAHVHALGRILDAATADSASVGSQLEAARRALDGSTAVLSMDDFPAADLPQHCDDTSPLAPLEPDDATICACSRASHGSRFVLADRADAASAERIVDVDPPPVEEEREEWHVPARPSLNSVAALQMYSSQGTLADLVPTTSAQRFVLWGGFDTLIGVVIAVNAAIMGVETSMNSAGIPLPLWLVICEHMFFFVYVCELSLRVTAFKWRAFESAWVRFDAFLVFCGSLDLLIKLTVDGESPLGEIFGKVMLIRMLRLARLARLVRLMVQFRVLWLLVQGLLASFQTLLWTFVIIAMLLYIFAIIALEVLKPDSLAGDDYNLAVDTYFCDLPHSLLTLVQGITVDSLSSIYMPIILAKPWTTVYFLCFILVVSISLMNLVTAIMVESSMEQASRDKEAMHAWENAEKKKLIHELEQVFFNLDADGSGKLELHELVNGPEEVQKRIKQVVNGNGPDEMHHIFHTLDYDSSGSIGINEFIEGLVRMSDGKPMELTCIMKQCKDILEETRTLAAAASGKPSQAALRAGYPEPGAKTGFAGAGAQVERTHTIV
eukprot:TRINITY_DN6159_c3_g1_i1.p1 TRINITY_DN6159_c3_g1~~TRINITY_DN6159_c3_g1_i1.p1  ORF type:complete len:597 (-),score=145.38 TRINITY_DN6159_c3_g1_i1:55-1845(-)